MQPLSGEIWLGHNVQVGYLPQHQENLTPERTVLEEILSVEELPLEGARTLLGSFLFSGDDVSKRIGELSGGERSRVALAKLTLRGANYLVLDEPANHLDIISREILTDVLTRYGGTILFVSHDRALADQLATQVWVIEGQALVVYRGNYSDYLAASEMRREQQGTASAQSTIPRKATSSSDEKETQKRLHQTAALEQQITELESQLEDLEKQLNLASQARQIEELHRLGHRYELTQEQLQELLAKWGQASS
jgi:ATP-binding cassette subfamily F protein 3